MPGAALSSSLFFSVNAYPRATLPYSTLLEGSWPPPIDAGRRSGGLQLRKEAAIFHLGHHVAPNHKYNSKENWQWKWTLRVLELFFLLPIPHMELKNKKPFRYGDNPIQ